MKGGVAGSTTSSLAGSGLFAKSGEPKLFSCLPCPPSPHHHTSRRSLARGQTHLCTPSPLPPLLPCLHHQGPLLQQQPPRLNHPSSRPSKPASTAIFSSAGYFGCGEFIKSLRRAIFERGGGRVSKIVLEDGNSGGRQVPTLLNPASSLSSQRPLYFTSRGYTYKYTYKYIYKYGCKYRNRLQVGTCPTQHPPMSRATTQPASSQYPCTTQVFKPNILKSPM